jgi:hypothetical protein
MTPSIVLTGGPPVVDDMWVQAARTRAAVTIETLRSM